MIEGRFVLPDDVRLDAVETLPAAALDGSDFLPGEFALTRPRTRTPTHIVSDSTARLLRIFHEPTAITDAVIRFSEEEGADPAIVLDEAFPALQTLIGAGLLVPSDSPLAPSIDFLLPRNETVGGLVIEQPIAVIADTEVYRARTADGGSAAIKIARPGAEERLDAALRHEAAVLELLDGVCSPRLFSRGDHAGRPFLAMEWCRGIDVVMAAEIMRGEGSASAGELRSLALAILDAYVRLHDRGVLHGDVHPRNLLVGASGTVTVIDFGQAHANAGEGATRQPARGVVDLYMEPELAAARLAGEHAPPPTPEGEQYSLAAVLFFLISGAHTHDFVLEERQMLAQVSGQPVMSFEARGVSGFEHAENVLRKALDKHPERRFASVRAFARALAKAFERDAAAGRSSRPRSRGAPPAARDLLDAFLERAALGGTLLVDGIPPPLASVNFGSAGLATAMLHIARRRADASLLAVADVWSQRALTESRASPGEAFTASDLKMSHELVGQVSLYHSAPGLACVAALIADAQADEARRADAIESFVLLAGADEARSELVFGMSGALLGCSLLLDAVGSAPGRESALLRTLGGALSGRLLAYLEKRHPIGGPDDASTLGIAHGHAGILYALLQWARLTNEPVNDELLRRMEQLASLAQPAGRGIAWPVSTHGRRALDGMRATWCNGAAGHLQLWLLAHETIGEPRYLRLASDAAWTCYEAPRTAGDLCCGSAGRAYALLRLFRQTGEEVWLERARGLARHAATAIRTTHLRRDSLYRGEAGVCALAADLDDPEEARMPMFELP